MPLASAFLLISLSFISLPPFSLKNSCASVILHLRLFLLTCSATLASLSTRSNALGRYSKSISLCSLFAQTSLMRICWPTLKTTGLFSLQGHRPPHYSQQTSGRLVTWIRFDCIRQFDEESKLTTLETTPSNSFSNEFFHVISLFIASTHASASIARRSLKTDWQILESLARENVSYFF